MPESTVISLLDVILKVLPSAISFVEDLVGHGGTINPEHVPQILSHMAELSKNSADGSNLSIDTQNHADATQSLSHEPHAE